MALKIALTTVIALQLRQSDHPFIIKTDASDCAISAVLSQRASLESSPLLPVAFFSKKLNAVEQKYLVCKYEILAI